MSLVVMHAQTRHIRLHRHDSTGPHLQVHALLNDKELLIELSHTSSGRTSKPLDVVHIEVYSLCSTSNIHGITPSHRPLQQTVSLSSTTHISSYVRVFLRETYLP